MKKLLPTLYLSFLVLIYISCSKDSPSPTPPPTGCSGINITVVGTTTAASSGLANGAINVSGNGSTSFTYSLNGGTFQSSGNFPGLVAGSYAVSAKNANGCTGSAQFNVGAASACSGTPGPLFNAVKQLMAVNCAISGCHVGPNPQSGQDFSLDCTIVDNSTRIKARAVDGIPSFMPAPPRAQLSAADKQKIVAWVNAGGQLSN